MRELFLLCVLQRVVVPVCVVLCGSWSCGCRSHWNGCMNVAWAMFWGGSRSTKPCVFPCKVAAGDDERYLVCAAGAAGVVSCANCSSYVFCNEWLFLCAKFYAVLQSLVAWSHWNGCMNVAWAMFWGGSRSTKPCVFPCKVAAGDDERYLVCAAGAAGVVSCANCSSYVFCNEWLFLCAKFYAVLQSLVAWSHWNGCMNVAWAMFWGGSRSTKPCVFPCKVAAGDDERYLVCAAGAAGVVSCANCSSYVFCNEWLFLCAKFYAVLQSLVAWSHWNGCMNVAWAMFWGGSRSTKPCVFPCKVAAGDDERYLVCAAGAARVVSCANCSSYVFCNEWLFLCAKFYAVLEAVVADRIGMAAWMLRGLCFGEEAGARNLVFFRVKWLQPAMKGTSSVRRVRLGSFHARIVPPMCFATSGCSCVRSSMRFLKLWLQIALEWLHECCMGNVLGRKPEHETLCFSV